MSEATPFGHMAGLRFRIASFVVVLFVILQLGNFAFVQLHLVPKVSEEAVGFASSMVNKSINDHANLDLDSRGKLKYITLLRGIESLLLVVKPGSTQPMFSRIEVQWDDDFALDQGIQPTLVRGQPCAQCIVLKTTIYNDVRNARVARVTVYMHSLLRRKFSSVMLGSLALFALLITLAMLALWFYMTKVLRPLLQLATKLQGWDHNGANKGDIRLPAGSGAEALQFKQAFEQLIARVDSRNEALRDCERQLHLLVDTAGEGIFGLDLRGRCVFANTACDKLLGYESGQLVGADVLELISVTHTDISQYRRWTADASALATVTQERVRRILKRADGSTLVVDYMASPMVRNNITVGVVVHFADISAFIKAEQEFKALTTMLPVGVFRLTLERRIYYANPACLNLLGMNLEEVAGQSSVLNLACMEDRERLRQEWNAQPSNWVEYDCEFRLSLGTDESSDCWVMLHLHKEYDLSGYYIGATGSIIDISVMKSAEAQSREFSAELEQRVVSRTTELMYSNSRLKESLDQLRNAQARLMETEQMAALGELVAGVAHEINTPIGISVGAASYLEIVVETYTKKQSEGPLEEADYSELFSKINEASGMIMSNLKRAAMLIRSFKQVAVDQSVEEKRFFNVAEYTREILQSLGHNLNQKNYKVAVSCDQDIEYVGYAGAYAQIVTNLVMNSLIHGFEDKGEGSITIDIKALGGDLCINYSDDGVGMAPDQRLQIFKPFYTTKRGKGGSGLGMSVVYNLVSQLLKGDIGIDSKPGEGVHFFIRFPM